MHDKLLALRDIELESARSYLPPVGVVLEIGAGNGWQARQLTNAGLVVLALDVDATDPVLGEHHGVALYDGLHLPLPDDSVDAVFSSNVLEHVRDLSGLLDEARRVLRPGGRAVHVLPNPVWRVWTIAARYPFLIQFATRRRGLPPTSKLAAQGGPSAPRSLRDALAFLRSALIEAPHGEFKSSLQEVSEYRATRWASRFAAAGWTVQKAEPAGVFYTGYGIMPRLNIDRRRKLSKLLGSSCTIFVIVPATAASHSDRTARS